MITSHDDLIRKDIKSVIEETNDAYHDFSTHNYMNSDYADFASMALGQFRNALRDPGLTREELERILRKGMKKHRAIEPQSCWTTFMAAYLAKASNGNGSTS